ncbi:AMP-binding protein [Nocardioides pocheonensis]|uniref:AMP-dependent synthetase n=1 Tax=Nocardioides pocheonensis TaxID=661485 RepID=A0A3N0GHX2_9ACTN|nr:AMP-binding protein [Nocardioides pocheonensis]RNM12037.1 AMP-dependent synthetase [Nocardioides pocheonensis]
MSSPTERVSALLRDFREDVSAIWLMCDRHPEDAVAFTVVDEDLSASDVTFGDLRSRSTHFAAGLVELGVEPGDRVATLMGKGLDFLTAVLGTWRAGAVYVPLFTAFGPQAIASRLERSRAVVVVTDAGQRAKLDPGPDMPAERPWRVVIADESAARESDVTLAALLRSDGSAFSPLTGGDAPIVHMFTSGTTGTPKGVIHPLHHVAAWQSYLEHGLHVTADDNYWCAADPGWAYGFYSAVAAPLAAGTRSILVKGAFNAATTWKVLKALQVTNFTAAPTVYRALRASDDGDTTLGLRRASSAGEPLTPEVNVWAEKRLGIRVHDHYGQTEIGMLLGNCHHPQLAREPKAGSMGRALPGFEVVVLHQQSDDVAPMGELGRLAVEIEASPLMTFAGYQQPSPSADKFAADGRYYLTGDLAKVDVEDDYFFSSRDDDVIIMAGYRIGPFEVESVLSQHDAVSEAAVVAVPDEIRGEVMEAHVALRPGYTAGEALAVELQRWVKEKFAAHAYPRAVHFTDALPKTPSGKVQRYLLRQRSGEPQ